MFYLIVPTIYIIWSHYQYEKTIKSAELRSRLHTKYLWYLDNKIKNSFTEELSQYFYFRESSEEDNEPLEDYLINYDYVLFSDKEEALKYLKK